MKILCETWGQEGNQDNKIKIKFKQNPLEAPPFLQLLSLPAPKEISRFIFTFAHDCHSPKQWPFFALHHLVFLGFSSGPGIGWWFLLTSESLFLDFCRQQLFWWEEVVIVSPSRNTRDGKNSMDGRWIRVKATWATFSALFHEPNFLRMNLKYKQIYIETLV